MLDNILNFIKTADSVTLSKIIQLAQHEKAKIDADMQNKAWNKVCEAIKDYCKQYNEITVIDNQTNEALVFCEKNNFEHMGKINIIW